MSLTKQTNLFLFKVIKDLREKGTTTKAGIWQANELFKDEEMLVKRNLNFTLSFHDDFFKFLNLEEIGADLPWAEDHFQERVSGKPTNPGITYKYWPYAKFKDGDDPYQHGKVFSHTYQERFWPKKANDGPADYPHHWGIRYEYGDLNDVIQQLKDNPLTRQAYLPIFFPEDTGAVHKQRVPCTLGYYFWIEDEELRCNYIIRSCDALRHFRNDVYLTGRLLQYVAKELDIVPATLTFYCFNLHVFRNDLYALKKKEQKLWKQLIG